MQYLSQLYYNEAIAAESHSEPFDHSILKIKNLAKSSITADGEDVFTTKDVSTMLGLWYRVHGKQDEAKSCLKPRILEGIDTLTDDDPENDVWGYRTLAETLLKAGDWENAGAAFAITTAPLDKLKAIRRAKQKAIDQSIVGGNTNGEGSTPAVPIEESIGSTAPANSTAPETNTKEPPSSDSPQTDSPTAPAPNPLLHLGLRRQVQAQDRRLGSPILLRSLHRRLLLRLVHRAGQEQETALPGVRCQSSVLSGVCGGGRRRGRSRRWWCRERCCRGGSGWRS